MPLWQALALLALLAMGLAITPAHAVPSFAQQTGMPCQQCHTTAYGPALTDYGRQFKLNGYVFGGNKPLVPVALMIQGGYTQTSADQPFSFPACSTSVLASLTSNLPGASTLSALTTPSLTSIE